MVSQVGRFKPAIILGSFLCGLLVGTAVFFSASVRGDGDRCTLDAGQFSSAGNIFDPTQLKVGDRFGQLTARTLDVSCFNDRYVGTASFQGEIVVSGVYDPQTEITGGTEACFHVVSYSESQLPRLLGDERKPWFCFRDVREAQELFGVREASVQENRVFLANIAIDNYQIVYQPTDSTNVATLVRVIDKIPLSPQSE